MLIVKGRQAVKESLESHQKPTVIFVPAGQNLDQDLASLLEKAKRMGIPLQRIDKKRFHDLAQDKHQQIIAQMKDIKGFSFDELLEERPSKIVVLDHLEDPHNMGAIFRTCEALGIQHVIYPKLRSAKLSSGVIRASAGAIWHLKLCEVSNIAQRLRQLKDHDYWLYAASEHAENELNEAPHMQPAAFVFGNEHHGVSKIVQKIIDTSVRIKMRGRVSSLNVSVAAGIVLNHFTESEKQ